MSEIAFRARCVEDGRELDVRERSLVWFALCDRKVGEQVEVGDLTYERTS
jgi:hypothetical protein